MTCPDAKSWSDTQAANDCVSSSKWNELVTYLKDKIRNVSIDEATVSEDGYAIVYDHGNTKYTYAEIVTPTNTKTLTNKTIDADNNTISNLAHGAEVDNPSSGVHGVTGNVVGTTDTQTLTGKTIDGDDNTVQDLSYSAIKSTSRSGSDTTLITGTKGTDGNLSQWNADGDLVDSKTPPTGDIVGTSDTQELTNKTIGSDTNTLTIDGGTA